MKNIILQKLLRNTRYEKSCKRYSGSINYSNRRTNCYHRLFIKRIDARFSFDTKNSTHQILTAFQLLILAFHSLARHLIHKRNTRNAMNLGISKKQGIIFHSLNISVSCDTRAKISTLFRVSPSIQKTSRSKRAGEIGNNSLLQKLQTSQKGKSITIDGQLHNR